MTIQSLPHADTVGREVPLRVGLKRKSELGQFMTPAAVARFMASLFPPSAIEICRLLDAGAGAGALSSAFLDRWAAADGFAFKNTELEAFEIDATLGRHLETTLATYAERLPFRYRIFSDDF